MLSLYNYRCLTVTNHFIDLQLHSKFDKLKKDHTEEKKKLEESRKKLEDDILEFNRRKAQFAQQPQHHTLTLGKSKKKWRVFDQKDIFLYHSDTTMHFNCIMN